MIPYIALHNHSYYSMLDSACRVDDLVAAATREGMEALALTDRDGLFGAVEFTQKCHAAGIRPIIGCELTLEGGAHLLLLCANMRGYGNLCALLTRDTREQQPVSWERLARHGEGLVALSGCRHGEVPALLRQGRRREAMRRAEEYAAIFKDYYIELWHHEPVDAVFARQLARLAAEMQLPIVATPNTHYLRPQDHRIYQVLTSIRTLTLLEEAHPEKKLSGSYHFKSVSQMNQLFVDLPAALENSIRIASQCHAHVLENVAPAAG